MDRLLAFGGLLACVTASACGADPATPAAPAAELQAPVGGAAVGYDLRRLRPRDQETLAAMFDRLVARAAEDGKHVAVLFSADWCEPCQRLALELGNEHPAEKISAFRILEVKEEDWRAATRMGEFNALRRRWYAPLDSYPVFIVLDAQGSKVEEMKEAIGRLEAAELEPTVANWFQSIAQGRGPRESRGV